MISKQVWLVGTDTSGRSNFGAEQAVFNFDLKAALAPCLKSKTNNILYRFVKNEHGYGVGAYIHAYEAEDKRRLGSYVGVAFQFPYAEMVNPSSLIETIDVMFERISRVLTNYQGERVFKDRLSNQFAGFFESENWIGKLSALPLIVSQPKNQQDGIVLIQADKNNVSTILFAFLIQNKLHDVYVTLTEVNDIDATLTLKQSEFFMPVIVESLSSINSRVTNQERSLKEQEQQIRNQQGVIANLEGEKRRLESNLKDVYAELDASKNDIERLKHSNKLLVSGLQGLIYPIDNIQKDLPRR